MCLDAEGRITGLLGSLEVPFLLSKELEQREDRLHAYYRAKVTELSGQRDAMKSKTEHYLKEVCFFILYIYNRNITIIKYTYAIKASYGCEFDAH